ncbi:GTPase obg [Trichinella pseudospiralis]|uniref:GTPase obg n=3 Tax=Trichinella pseudospiralis TaxID=6337 RepID=A0A0V1JM73_TRIPS|nr:GTPase obg [Trichinella pseudospiralis]
MACFIRNLSLFDVDGTALAYSSTPVQAQLLSPSLSSYIELMFAKFNKFDSSCDEFCRTMRGNLKLRSGFKAWSKILTKQSAIADSPAADSRYKLKVPKKPRAAGNTQSHFVDFKIVRTIGGNGGDGMIAFLRLFCNSKAGPSGGDGGNGGHVIFQADSSLTSLARVPRVIRAKAGENGRGKSCHGASANHFWIRIPTGTVCRREAGTGDEVELTNHGEIFIAARGGAGGRGNQSFVSATWQLPTIAEAGGRGEDIVYQLELRLIADVGLIGFPNVGKSTLLRALSRARPKVADYAFTTVRPHIGVIQYADGFSVTVADLPGIVEGAHMNRGLGFQFLRHIRRCVCLCFVVDVSVQNPRNQLQTLLQELSLYDQALLGRRKIVVANKIDIAAGVDVNDMLQLPGLLQQSQTPVIAISATSGQGIESLVEHIRKMVNQ